VRVLTAAIPVVKVQVNPPIEVDRTTVYVYQHVNRKSLVPRPPEKIYFAVTEGEELRVDRAPDWDIALEGFEKAFRDDAGNAYIAVESMSKINRILNFAPVDIVLRPPKTSAVKR